MKVINRDFENLFEDINNKTNLLWPRTDHMDNCAVSVLNYSLSKGCKFTRNCYSKTTSSLLVLAKKTLSTCSQHEHSGSSQEAVSGFRFIDLAQLASLAEELLCPQ